MKSLLYIIVDISGSMNEMGKIHLQRNLCRYISQLKLIDKVNYTDVAVRFFQWKDVVSEILTQVNGDIPALTPKGSSDLNVLSDFIINSLSDEQMLCALILSDGNYINSDISDFQEQLRNYPNMLLRTVAIGADSDLRKLREISSNGSVYLAENISAAINSACFGTDENVTDPESTGQIKFSQQAEPEDDWDA